MEFKKLEVNKDSSWLKRLLTSGHFRKSVLYILIGALIALGITYFSEGRGFSEISSDKIITNILTGAFIGFFLTNSPCARNKC